MSFLPDMGVFDFGLSGLAVGIWYFQMRKLIYWHYVLEKISTHAFLGIKVNT